MEESKLKVPLPKTPLERKSSFGSTEVPKTPKTPLKSPSFFFKKSEEKKLEAINEILDEVERVRGDADLRKTFEEINLEDCQLQEGEKRVYITPKSAQDTNFKTALEALKEWINDILSEEDISIENMKADFSDGVVFKKIVEKLSGQTIKLPLAEDVQAKERQMKNLETVLDKIGEIIRLSPDLIPWNVSSVYEQNLLANVQILLALVDHFTPQGKLLQSLPEVLSVNAVQLQMNNGRIESIVKPLTIFKNPGQKDDFDSFLDKTPEKINFVKRNLIQFTNAQLNKINIKIEDLSKDFCNGNNLILLVGMIQGFFVPLHEYNQTPKTFEDKMENVSLGLEFLQEMGFKSRNHPSDIVNGNLRAILRIIYFLFVEYNTKMQ